MANQLFFDSLHRCIRAELAALLAGDPSVYVAGVTPDPTRGALTATGPQSLRDGRAEYPASDFLFGYIPLQGSPFPYLFFQVPALNTMRGSVPGNIQLAGAVLAPVPETYVAPLVGWGYRFVPLSALAAGLEPRAAFRDKAGSNAFLEAVNGDKATVKGMDMRWIGAQVSGYTAKLDVSDRYGLHQVAPYKGYTILTAQAPPHQKAEANLPIYEFRRRLEVMAGVARHALAHPEWGENVGTQIVGPSNGAMMDLLHRQLDQAVAAGASPAGARGLRVERTPAAGTIAPVPATHWYKKSD